MEKERVGAAHHVRGRWPGPLGAEATSVDALDVMCGKQFRHNPKFFDERCTRTVLLLRFCTL